MRKDLKPGSGFTVRLPSDIDEGLLSYINTKDNRNKVISNWVLEKAREEMRGGKDKIDIQLPKNLSSEKKNQIRQSINGLLEILLGDPTKVEKDEGNLIDEHVLSSMQGLLLDDET